VDEASNAEANAFVQRRGAALRRLAFVLTGNLNDADDLLQTTLVKVIWSWQRVSRAENPDAYVKRMMVNAASTTWRSTQRNREVLLAHPPDRGTSDGGTAQTENRAVLMAALGRLPARQRAVMLLRYHEDMSEADTATLLQCSVGTVKSQAARGLARMRYELSSVGVQVVDTAPSIEGNSHAGH
jgi:RNA polymerase sigma-70 factor (sigma-E family)